jgi:MiaB/RimO family radical SAM methylthiotransferase
MNGMAFTEDYAHADLIVISTCAFVKEREDQSLQAIQYYRGARAKHSKLVVAGCLSKISPESIKEYDDIAFLSPRELDDFDRLIDAQVPFKDIPEPNKIYSHPVFPGLSDLRPPKAKTRLNRRLDEDYEREDLFTIRIARGCTGNCSYCAIKFAAGRLESKPVEAILAEFKNGLAQGYDHMTLVAGDTGCYGVDIGTDVVELLSRMFDVNGTYKLVIKEFNAQWLIKYYAKLEKLLLKRFDKIDYMIIPVQSASNKILRLMNRPYKIEDVRQCLQSLRSKIPAMRVTTHIMAGFPGETEADFQKSLDFVKEFRFPYVDIYGYEDRPGTQAGKLPDKVPQGIIDSRIKVLRRAQDRILQEDMKLENPN